MYILALFLLLSKNWDTRDIYNVVDCNNVHVIKNEIAAIINFPVVNVIAIWNYYFWNNCYVDIIPRPKMRPKAADSGDLW